MPREGIDYPGWWNRAACSIRCELLKLWSAVGSKVAKVNTVEPDGDGQVKIVSDSATLTVTDDPSNNAVRLELDAGLSNPPVDSVNGQTGTVVLGATNISGLMKSYDGTSISVGSATVKQRVDALADGAKAGDDALRTRMTAAETAISAEASDRATADNALAAQIATKADTYDTVVKNPSGAQSIAGYDLEIQEDLDVDGDLTVGGTSDLSVATGTTGTYSTKAANSQRIKNELDAYSPMVRTSGNQTIAGVKTHTGNLEFNKGTPSSPFIIMHTTYDPNVTYTGNNVQFQAQTNDTNGQFMHYISMATTANGERTMNHVIQGKNGTVGYFNLSISSSGTLAIYTNFPKPSNW